MRGEDVILKIERLHKDFAVQSGGRVVLDAVSLEVRRNEFLCILGPSGCGKTTLLRCIAGFEEYAGDIFVEGERKAVPGIDRMMVFQDFNQLFPWKTVEQNVRYPLWCNGVRDRSVLEERSSVALEKVKLGAYGKFYPHQLSGGMKQRVAIAKALALRPKIILMDEPFAALDAMTRRDLQGEMLSIAGGEECTVIFVTHNIQEALVLGSRVMVLARGGRVVLDEENPLAKPVTPASAGYGALWERLYRALYAG